LTKLSPKFGTTVFFGTQGSCFSYASRRACFSFVVLYFEQVLYVSLINDYGSILMMFSLFFFSAALRSSHFRR